MEKEDPTGKIEAESASFAAPEESLDAWEEVDPADLLIASRQEAIAKVLSELNDPEADFNRIEAIADELKNAGFTQRSGDVGRILHYTPAEFKEFYAKEKKYFENPGEIYTQFFAICERVLQAFKPAIS